MDLLVRFLIGGLVVAAFALIGDIFKPKSFAGLFGAAPSIALATLGLTIAKHGGPYAAVECRSMLAGALALAIYTALVCLLLVHRNISPLAASLYAVIVWFGVSFGAWLLFLR